MFFELARYNASKRWIALDLVVVDVSERGSRLGSTLMDVFFDLFPSHEVLLNSEIEVQKFYELFNFVEYRKAVHKRPKQVKSMDPQPSTKLMIRTQVSNQAPISMPQTRDHSNPLGQFLHKTAGIPAKYPEYDENSNRIFYVKSQYYYCSFCPNDGGQTLVRRDKKTLQM